MFESLTAHHFEKFQFGASYSESNGTSSFAFIALAFGLSMKTVFGVVSDRYRIGALSSIADQVIAECPQTSEVFAVTWLARRGCYAWGGVAEKYFEPVDGQKTDSP